MTGLVDLVVPVKRLDRAKSRLRGAVEGEHAELVLALLTDTVTAALAARSVGRVLVVCEDDRVPAALRATGAECVDERGLPGLNAALDHGAALLGAGLPGRIVGALQADLPTLRLTDLDAAIAEAAGRRAYVADRQGTGTVLLLSAVGGALDPRFGPGSASAHRDSAAVTVGVSLDTLRCDVDTGADLDYAVRLGVGALTSDVVSGKFTWPPAR